MKYSFVVILTFVSHNQGFLYEPRGFSSIEEHDEALIENWNKVVKPNDIVYHLGDTMLNDNEKGVECFKRLNGQISLIWGNHDSDARKELLSALPNVIVLGYAHVFKYKKFSIYLSHYPTLTANYDSGKHFSRNVINLHGHVHGRTPWINPRNPFMYDVGMDSHNCTPIHIDEVMTDIRQRWQDLQTLKIPIANGLYSYPM